MKKSEKSSKQIPDQTPRERMMGDVPDDLWVKCTGCARMIYTKELEQNLKVCSHCNCHMRLTADERIAYTVDEDSFVERDANLVTLDPLSFPNYQADLERYRKATGRKDSFVWGDATIGERPIVLGVSEFGFIGGSMGSVMGEKIARAAEEAARTRHPLILISSGGGARMHEGIVSLMQMAKTTAAVTKLGETGVPFISVFADPMTAGIAASFAFMADIIIAEPEAIIGFAGPRVVEQAYRIKLPPDSMTSEFNLKHGMLDMVVPRKEMRPTLIRWMQIIKPSI